MCARVCVRVCVCACVRVCVCGCVGERAESANAPAGSSGQRGNGGTIATAGSGEAGSGQRSVVSGQRYAGPRTLSALTAHPLTRSQRTRSVERVVAVWVGHSQGLISAVAVHSVPGRRQAELMPQRAPPESEEGRGRGGGGGGGGVSVGESVLLYYYRGQMRGSCIPNDGAFSPLLSP